ncbi:MAG: hypothetical protein ACR2OH_01980 [Microthrixaceae bacterium]
MKPVEPAPGELASPPAGDPGQSSTNSTETAVEPTAESEDSEKGALQAEVDELLSAFDDAYSALAAHPLDALDDSSAAVEQWHPQVVAGSNYDKAIRARLHTDAQDNLVLYRPDANGLLMASHASDLAVEADGSLAWTHCHFTPWVEVHAETGEILDDRPFQRLGTASATRGGDGRLRITHISEDQLMELPEGSGDQCEQLGE